MSKANEAELGALQDEQRDLLTQLVRVTKEYVDTVMPLRGRLTAVEDKLGKIPGGL